MALSQGIETSRRKPLPPGVAKTPQYRYPCVALAVGINFASCLAGIQRTDCRKIYRECRASFSKLSSFLPLSLSFFLFPSQTGCVKVGQENFSSHATCPLLSGSLDYTLSTYPSTMDFHPLTRCHLSPMASHLSSLFE